MVCDRARAALDFFFSRFQRLQVVRSRIHIFIFHMERGTMEVDVVRMVYFRRFGIPRIWQSVFRS
jgi:hypothetical protein